MSFASETKKEMTQEESKPCCAKAELSALIRMNGSMSFSNKMLSLDVQTENAAIARRLYTLIKAVISISSGITCSKKNEIEKK